MRYPITIISFLLLCVLNNLFYAQHDSSSTGNILTFDSEPQGASVYVDSIYYGVTPLIINDLPNGKYKSVLKMDGFGDKVNFLELKGEKVEKFVIMSGDYALLNLTSEPSGADFYFNDIKMGQTPVINFKMPLGRQSITLKYAEYKEATTYLQVVSYKYKLDKKLIPAYSIFHFPENGGISLYVDDAETLIEGDSAKIFEGKHEFKFSGKGIRRPIEDDFYIEPAHVYNIRVLENQRIYKNVYRSAFLPGFGQIKDGAITKGWIIMGSFFAAGGYTLYNAIQRQDKITEYDDLRTSYENANTEVAAKEFSDKFEALANEANSYRDKIYLGIGVMGGIYVINLIDAFLNHSIGSNIEIKMVSGMDSGNITLKWRLN